MPSLTHNALFLRPISNEWSIYSTSSYTAGNPALSIQHKRPGIFARSTDTTSGSPAFIRMDAGASTPFNPGSILVSLAYLKHDGDLGTLKYRVRASNSATFTTTTYDSGPGGIAVDSPFGGRSFAHVLDNAGSGFVDSRYIEISLWATGASYLDIGVAFVGDFWQPLQNLQPRGLVSPSSRERVGVVRGQKGQEFDRAGTIFDGTAGRLLIQSRAELNSWEDLASRVGSSGRLLFVLDPLESTYRQQQFLYGRFIRLGQPRQLQDSLWSVDFVLEEDH